MIQEVIDKFRKLSTYNPSKGILNEGFYDEDTTGWVCVGEVPFWPWGGDGDKVYIMVNPQKTMKWGQMLNDIKYTENKDGSGRQIDSISSAYKDKIIIYPEHQDDEFGEMFLGKRKDKSVAEKMHEEFVSKLFKAGENVIIHHNSSYVLKDGVIKKGTPNGWSNNTDIGIYFWGSRSGGNDPSNASSYTYYSIIPLKEIYDFETNEERLSLEQAMSKYRYAGQLWKDGDAVVITTFKTTPIWCILDKQTGKWYDKEWNEIKKPF